MNVDAKCKFCGKALVLKVDDAFFEEFKTATVDTDKGRIKMADLSACNRCADFRVERRKIFDRIKFNCMMIFGGAVPKEGIPLKREALEILIKRYMRLLADHKNAPIPDWDNALVDDMIEKPGNYSLILAQIPKMFAQPTLV
jgi:hypothetical protein